MTTESVELIIGGKFTGGPAFAKAKQEQQTFERSIGDTADTSARTTAALALMLQTMDDSPIAKLITDLSILKGTLDSVRAAQSQNASSFEKLVANASLYFAAFNAAGSVLEFWRQSTDRVKEYNRQLAEVNEVTAIMLRSQAEGRSGGVDVQAEREGLAILQQRLIALKEQRAEMEATNRRNLGFFGDPEQAELINAKIKQTQTLIRDRNDALRSYQKELEAAERAEKRAYQDSFRIRDENNKKIVQGLEDQVRALQMTQDELTLYELRQNGVRKADEERALAAIKLRDELIAQKKAQEELIAQQQADERDRELEQLRKRNELEAELKRIIESNMTPLERFQKEYQKLAEVRAAGGLSDDVFRKALTKLRDDLVDATDGQSLARTVGPLQQDSSRFLARAQVDQTPVQLTANSTKKTAEILAEAKKIFEQVNANLAQIKQNTAGKTTVFKGSA